MTEKRKVLQWPSQSPDLNLIEMLWRDLKSAVHNWTAANLNELKQRCEEAWTKVLHKEVRDCHTKNNYFKFLLLKVVLRGKGPWGILRFSHTAPVLWLCKIITESYFIFCHSPGCIYLITWSFLMSYYILICKEYQERNFIWRTFSFFNFHSEKSNHWQWLRGHIDTTNPLISWQVM